MASKALVFRPNLRPIARFQAERSKGGGNRAAGGGGGRIALLVVGLVHSGPSGRMPNATQHTDYVTLKDMKHTE